MSVVIWEPRYSKEHGWLCPCNDADPCKPAFRLVPTAQSSWADNDARNFRCEGGSCRWQLIPRPGKAEEWHFIGWPDVVVA